MSQGWTNYDAPDQDRVARRFRYHVRRPGNPKGPIVRPEACPFCDGVGPIEAHHPDYTKPFRVVWCCFSCHRRIEAGSITVKPKHIHDYSGKVRQHRGGWIDTPF